MKGNAYWIALCCCALLATLAACSEETTDFDPGDPARGPGELVGNGQPLTDGNFAGGDDQIPAAREVASLPEDHQPPDCGADCRSYCDGLNLQNPVNRGVCKSLWGVGLSTRPVVSNETCRRMFADMIGRFPSYGEVAATCEGRSWGEVAKDLMARDEFVFINQRRWADRFLYNNQVVSIERIYDMDSLVGKVYRGMVAYDQFGEVASAHPVMTRRFDTAGDRAEAVFRLLMGRPPLGDERSDFARLYRIWNNGYYDHPQLGLRLPDAEISYEVCRDEETGEAEPGQCTSILWGFNPLVLDPDIRAAGEDAMWSGLMRAEEWKQVQLPGRILAGTRTFWENAVDDVLYLYLGYDIGTDVPEVRDELVRFLIENNGDIRSVHFAVVTSALYLQSSNGATERNFRWTYGPLKQADAEVWIDTIKTHTGYNLSQCDHRLPRPDDLLEEPTISGMIMLQGSRWDINDEGEIVGNYRSLARNLGGCPENEIGGRFKTVSILTTASQLSFVANVCTPTDGGGAPIATLLPGGMDPAAAVTPDVAIDIANHQMSMFFGRGLTPEEDGRIRGYGEACENSLCRAEDFARPACFALLSSAEMLFY